MNCISCSSSSIEIIQDGDQDHAICMDCGESWIANLDLRDSTQRINDLEKSLGIRLPDTLRQPLIQGRSILDEGFKVALPDNLPRDEHWDYFLEPGPFEVWPIQCESDATLMQNADLRQEWDIPKEIVLLFGDGHTWLGLDYTVTPTDPPVVYITTGPFRKIELFKTFGHLLNAQK